MNRLDILREITEDNKSPKFYRWDSSWNKLKFFKLDNVIDKSLKNNYASVDGLVEVIHEFIEELSGDIDSGYSDESLKVKGKLTVFPQKGEIVLDVSIGSDVSGKETFDIPFGISKEVIVNLMKQEENYKGYPIEVSFDDEWVYSKGQSIHPDHGGYGHEQEGQGPEDAEVVFSSKLIKIVVNGEWGLIPSKHVSKKGKATLKPVY